MFQELIGSRESPIPQEPEKQSAERRRRMTRRSRKRCCKPARGRRTSPSPGTRFFLQARFKAALFQQAPSSNKRPLQTSAPFHQPHASTNRAFSITAPLVRVHRSAPEPRRPLWRGTRWSIRIRPALSAPTDLRAACTASRGVPLRVGAWPLRPRHTSPEGPSRLHVSVQSLGGGRSGVSWKARAAT
jgi:hypothetical protein